MVATTDAGYATMGWTTSGEACLGVSPSCGNSSGPSTVPFWENCGTGLRCTGTVILHTYLMGPQTITARIFNAAGTITLNGTVLTNGQNLTLGHGQVVPISGNVSNSSYIFLKWLTDDGSLANANSSSTNLTVDSNPSSQGNLTMVVKLISGNYSYAGLIATGSAISKAAATFVVPIVSYSCHIDCIYAQVLPLWVGIGGDSLLAGRGNLWQAGVTVYVNQTGGTKTEYAEAWYESFYSNGTHNFVPVTQVGLGTTVTVTVTYNALTGLSGYSIVCDNHPAAGCGYLPKNGSVLFTPTTTNAEWVTELGIGGFPELFTGSNLSFASPCLTASGVSSSSFVVPAGAYWAQGEPEWHLISVGTITPTWFGLEED
ncbi:MAG: G1 family glutamic endopeptidase [Thermoplasmata archaeon]